MEEVAAAAGPISPRPRPGSRAPRRCGDGTRSSGFDRREAEAKLEALLQGRADLGACRTVNPAGGMSAMIYEASTWVLPVIFAVTFHEAAHGFVAYRFGDDTALARGPGHFNPLKHVDPFGTIILPAMLILLRSPFLFGYAKPVPVNFAASRTSRGATWCGSRSPGRAPTCCWRSSRRCCSTGSAGCRRARPSGWRRI